MQPVVYIDYYNLPFYDEAIPTYFRDPITKRMAPNPVLCPQHHVNEFGVLNLAKEIEGQAKCGHRECRQVIENPRIDPWLYLYLQLWFEVRGKFILPYDYNQLAAETTQTVSQLRERQVRPEQAARPINLLEIVATALFFIALAYL